MTTGYSFQTKRKPTLGYFLPELSLSRLPVIQPYTAFFVSGLSDNDQLPPRKTRLVSAVDAEPVGSVTKPEDSVVEYLSQHHSEALPLMSKIPSLFALLLLTVAKPVTAGDCATKVDPCSFSV